MSHPEKKGFFRSLFGSGSASDASLALLPLHVPVPNKEAPDEASDPHNLVGHFSRQGLGAVPMLTEINRYLDQLNHWRLEPDQRVGLTNIALGHAVSAAAELYARFLSQGGGVPETSEQREGVSEGVRAAERLAISYKLVLRHDHAADDDKEGKRCQRLSICALRIMELARLEYLLRAFRYQKFPTHAWRDCNQVYFAVRDLVDVRAKKSLKVRLYAKSDAETKSLWPESGSIEELFVAIQIMGLVDAISWPSQFMPVIADYVLHCEPPLTLTDDFLGVMPVQHSAIYRSQAHAPRLGRGEDQLGEMLLLDLAPLCDRARADHQALLSEQAPSATLTALEAQDQLPFIDMLLKRLTPQERSDGRKAVFDARQVRIFGGFEDVYRLFRDLVREDQDAAKESREFWDSLAEHTLIVQGERAKGPEPRWIVADESPGGVQLRMHESPYSAPLHVGKLLAYTAGDETSEQSKLGYVVRLQRSADMAVEVAIARIKGKVTAVVVEDLDALDQRTLPALLVLHSDGGMALLCDNKHKFMTGDRLAVFINPKHPHTGALGDPVLSQSDFTMFELHTSG